ncbi:MAG TPA: hypothetical protein PKA88_13150 [Polyangiaceae bacterium]|nr:hypothetical protein [Polyangiaceae bacterium]
MRRDVCVLSFADQSENAAFRIGELCGVELAQARRLLRSAPTVLARNLDPAATTELERALRALGAEVVVQASAPAVAPAPAPGVSSVAPAPAPGVSSVAPASPLSGAPLAGPGPSPPPHVGGSGLELDVVAPLPAPQRSAIPRSFPPPPPPLGAPASSFVLSRRALVLGGGALVLGAGYLWWRPRRIGGLAVAQVGAGGDGAPTLVLLHGYGAPADDLEGLGEEVLQLSKLANARVLLPAGITRAGLGKAWYDSAADLQEARKGVAALLHEIIEDGTPAERIILGGFSQGAMLALDVGMSFQPRLYGVAMLSGGRIRGVDWSQSIGAVATTRFLITHGRGDGVLPAGAAEDIARQLQAQGADVSLVLFQGNHTIAPEARQELARFFGQMAAAAPP